MRKLVRIEVGGKAFEGEVVESYGVAEDKTLRVTFKDGRLLTSTEGWSVWEVESV